MDPDEDAQEYEKSYFWAVGVFVYGYILAISHDLFQSVNISNLNFQNCFVRFLIFFGWCWPIPVAGWAPPSPTAGAGAPSAPPWPPGGPPSCAGGQGAHRLIRT